ncbi:hypothetical protein [Pseudonocardia sp. D17]|uniref:hypothetical protein n=1 Tax=Pseudonocardia sp. D17 TaxID=882661 RepID=UPI002B3D8D21|nr:hypothetical protein PSD17_39250 [Pseudonocardia sp. D17]
MSLPSDPPVVPVVVDPPAAPRGVSALTLAQLVLLALLTVVAIATSVYSVTVGLDLRAAQQRIDCQSGQTEQLREAANIERDGLRPVFDAIKASDGPAIRAALDGYQAATVKADGVRQAIPACKPGDPAAGG